LGVKLRDIISAWFLLSPNYSEFLLQSFPRLSLGQLLKPLIFVITQTTTMRYCN